MKRSAAKLYRFRLQGYPWMTYIGPVHNKIEAEQALSSQFGSLLREVRLHPLLTEARENQRAAGRPKRGNHGSVA